MTRSRIGAALASAVRKHLLRRGLSQEALDGGRGSSPQLRWYGRGGERVPTIEVANRLAVAPGKTPSRLVGEAERVALRCRGEYRQHLRILMQDFVDTSRQQTGRAVLEGHDAAS